MDPRATAKKLSDKGWTAKAEACEIERLVYTGPDLDGCENDFLAEKIVPMAVWLELVKLDVEIMSADLLPW